MAHPTVFNTSEVLSKFKTPTTLKQAGVSAYLVKQALTEGLLAEVGKVETKKRGRPAKKFLLTSKGEIAIGERVELGTVPYGNPVGHGDNWYANGPS